jgi:hypothetical protein
VILQFRPTYFSVRPSGNPVPSNVASRFFHAERVSSRHDWTFDALIEDIEATRVVVTDIE